MSSKRKLAILRLEIINVHGTVRWLCSNIFVKRVPGDTLHVMAVFRQLADALASRGVVDTSDIVHGASYQVLRVRRPSKIIYLRNAWSAHISELPCFFVILSVFAKGFWDRRVTKWPQKDDAIITSRGQCDTLGIKPDYIDGLCVFGKSCKVCQWSNGGRVGLILILEAPNPYIVIAAGSRKPAVRAICRRLKVGAINGLVFQMPMHCERFRLHV